jgi:hypothetical protein
VDGSFQLDFYAGVVGAVVRDYEGWFIVASTIYLPTVASAAVAGAMATHEGLALANRLGCNSVLAESDCMETIQACTGEESRSGESSAIFIDCVGIAALIGRV